MKRYVVVLTLLACCAGVSRGDIVEYAVPRTNLRVTLQGRTQINPGRTVSFRHPKFGNLVFALQDVAIHKAPTTSELFSRRLGKAAARKDADMVMEAALWALRNGLLRQCHEAIQQALVFDSNHEEAGRMARLNELMQRPLGDSSDLAAELKAMVRKDDMRIARSPHFILLHDTPEKPDGERGSPRRKPRALERLELLEQVYESFLLKFYSKGVELEIPQERLKVILFNDQKMYLHYATSLSPELSSTAGFWDPKTNVSVFYDHGTTEQFKALKELSDVFQGMKANAIRLRTVGAADTVRMADTLSLLFQVAQEDADIEVVSHEATHQMAGNTGLLPRHVSVPGWVHEGLASYFEAPEDAAWSGIGAVNESRLAWYRALENDREHSNLDFIVGDQIFSYAASHAARLHGYGQAWALTHFLIEKHFDEFMTYYRRLGELPPDVKFSPELLNKLFDEVFTIDRKSLDFEWRAYMGSLKTDVELILEGE